jgi:hypothetical protein
MPPSLRLAARMVFERMISTTRLARRAGGTVSGRVKNPAHLYESMIITGLSIW